MFSTLFIKIVPLCFIVALGFFASRFLKIPKNVVADLVIYIISPIVVFGYVAQIELSWARMLLPLFTFLIPTIVSNCALLWSSMAFSDSHKNLCAYASACGNTGYLGVPVYLAIFGPEHLGLYMLAIIGYMFYETGTGYFILARGRNSVRQSIKKIFLLPTPYAAALGVVWSLLGLKLNADAIDSLAQFRGAFTVTGMMLVGLALGDLEKFSIDLKFTSLTLLGKFVAMPLVAGLSMVILQKVFDIHDLKIIQALATFSCVPLAANLTAYCTQLNMHPEKAACTVFISTVLSIFYMPFMIPLLSQV